MYWSWVFEALYMYTPKLQLIMTQMISQLTDKLWEWSHRHWLSIYTCSIHNACTAQLKIFLQIYLLVSLVKYLSVNLLSHGSDWRPLPYWHKFTSVMQGLFGVSLSESLCWTGVAVASYPGPLGTRLTRKLLKFKAIAWQIMKTTDTDPNRPLPCTCPIAPSTQCLFCMPTK